MSASFRGTPPTAQAMGIQSIYAQALIARQKPLLTWSNDDDPHTVAKSCFFCAHGAVSRHRARLFRFAKSPSFPPRCPRQTKLDRPQGAPEFSFCLGRVDVGSRRTTIPLERSKKLTRQASITLKDIWLAAWELALLHQAPANERYLMAWVWRI